MSEWPLIARHVGERRGRQQLEALGYQTPKLLPYGLLVMVRTKKYEEFQGHWRNQRKKAWIRGPDVSMSMTSGGHYLEDEEGKFLRSNDIVLDVVPEVAAVEDRGPLHELEEKGEERKEPVRLFGESL